jgi:hypothetical protein
MGSVLWMEGVRLGLERNIVQRYALETGSEQGFGTGEKVAHGTCSLSPRDLDRRGVRIAAISCGTHDAREDGLV